jgi:2-polyprenyl-6-hydroxyphenyl methylase/3-demethylubiquinone-9 3-methyltransferase
VTTTTNAAEIERFNALAATWWDPRGPMWPLHELNRARAPFVVQAAASHFGRSLLTSRPLAGLRVLDIGCGAGLLSEALARHGAAVTGVDPAERNISIARAHARSSGLEIDYRAGAVEDIDLPPVDIVLNMEVVEHVDNLPDFMARCCALTRPGGLQFVATINRNPLSWLVAIVGAEYILRYLPLGTHQWRKFVKPSEAADLLAAGGLSVIEQRGVAVNPLTRTCSVTGFTGVNYMLAARKHG